MERKLAFLKTYFSLRGSVVSPYLKERERGREENKRKTLKSHHSQIVRKKNRNKTQSRGENKIGWRSKGGQSENNKRVLQNERKTTHTQLQRGKREIDAANASI